MYFCSRLSYYQRIKEIVPEPYESLLPPMPEPHYKYAAENAGRNIIVL